LFVGVLALHKPTRNTQQWPLKDLEDQQRRKKQQVMHEYFKSRKDAKPQRNIELKSHSLRRCVFARDSN
jgi:hypothetical protein